MESTLNDRSLGNCCHQSPHWDAYHNCRLTDAALSEGFKQLSLKTVLLASLLNRLLNGPAYGMWQCDGHCDSGGFTKNPIFARVSLTGILRKIYSFPGCATAVCGGCDRLRFLHQGEATLTRRVFDDSQCTQALLQNRTFVHRKPVWGPSTVQQLQVRG